MVQSGVRTSAAYRKGWQCAYRLGRSKADELDAPEKGVCVHIDTGSALPKLDQDVCGPVM